jgi:glutaredoxin-like protein NrdH
VKEFLSRASVGFETRDVDVDDEAYEELMRLGMRTIPVTVIGEQVIRGFDPAALTAALEARQRGADGT